MRGLLGAVMLVGVTLLVAVCSEYLTGAIDSMSDKMSESFIGMLFVCTCHVT